MPDRPPVVPPENMFRPKGKAGLNSEEVGQFQREVEHENESIKGAFEQLAQDPQRLRAFMFEQILPLVTSLNMELGFIRFRKDSYSLDSVANSEYLFKNVKAALRGK